MWASTPTGENVGADAPFRPNIKRGYNMELPERKLNRLPNYDYSQNGAYFITICIQDRKQILSSIVGDDAHIVPLFRKANF